MQLSNLIDYAYSVQRSNHPYHYQLTTEEEKLGIAEHICPVFLHCHPLLFKVVLAFVSSMYLIDMVSDYIYYSILLII